MSAQSQSKHSIPMKCLCAMSSTLKLQSFQFIRQTLIPSRGSGKLRKLRNKIFQARPNCNLFTLVICQARPYRDLLAIKATKSQSWSKVPRMADQR